MWFFQRPRKLAKHYVAWSTICACAAIVHLIALFIFFSGYRSSSEFLKITLNSHLLNPSVPILFKPVLQKQSSAYLSTLSSGVVPQKAHSTSARLVSSAVHTSKQARVTSSVKKTSSPAKVVPQKTTVLKQPQKIAEKKVTPATVKKDVLPVKEIKKDMPLKAEKKQLCPLAYPAAVQKDMHPVAAPSSLDNKVTQKDKSVEKVPIVVSATADEIEAHRRSQIIHAALSHVWRPPKLIAKAGECIITVMIDHEGTIRTATIDKSSGILMYDISARSALYAVQLPEWVRGKSLTIVFNS